MTSVSIVIPALNEEAYLEATLQSVQSSISQAGLEADQLEVIVVDNGSTDRTAEIARNANATVVDAPPGNAGSARNAGARNAKGEVLVFVDADTLWPSSLLQRVTAEMKVPGCLGGAVDPDHRPESILVRAYLRFWKAVGTFFGMAQGATQFYRASRFLELQGYDATYYMGEDAELYWRLKRLARSVGGHVAYIRDIQVVPSCRRFDQWPVWKTLLLTNPLTCVLFARRRWPWAGWYQNPVR